MLQAGQRTQTLHVEDLFNELRKNDEAWLLETLQQRWNQLQATTKPSPSLLMKGMKRSRSPPKLNPVLNKIFPHDLTAEILPPSRSVSDHVTLIRDHDWASTPLGSMKFWSSALRRVVNFLLLDPRAAVLYWGQERIMLYNENYSAVLSEKHPWALGRSVNEVWPTTEALYKAFAKGDATGCSSSGYHEQFFVERRGFLEETYADWTVVPIADGEGSFAYYNVPSEVTGQVQYQRQMETLLTLERYTLESKSRSEFWANTLKALEDNKHEVPFALLYSSQSSRRTSLTSISDSTSSTDELKLVLGPWVLEGAIGPPDGSEAAPKTLDTEWALENISSNFKHAIISGAVQTLQIRDGAMSSDFQRTVRSREYGDVCSTAVLMPIGKATDGPGSGFLLLGLNPRRMYDASYQSFIRLLHRQLVSTLVSVGIAEDEERRTRLAAEMAALDRTLLSEQLQITTQHAEDNERRFRTIAEHIPIALYELSPDGDILFANQAYYELTGLDQHNLYPYCWEDVIHPAKRDLYEANYKLQAAGETVRFESRLNKPWVAEDLLQGGLIEGETWVLSAGYAVRNTDGSIRSLQGALIDISRQKWMESLQGRRLQEAIELKRQQETFMDMVGHEIRNPLSAITLCAGGILESLEHALESSPHGDVMLNRADVVSHIENSEIITTCINHQRRIIDDILTISKMDSGLLVVAPCEVQPSVVIEQSLRMFAGEVEESDINLRCTIDESYRGEKVDWVLLDPSRLLQVFLNLVTNAIKFTRKEAIRNIDVTLAASTLLPDRSLTGTLYLDFGGPSLETESSAQHEEDAVYIMISVKDTGCGVKADELEKIFLRFQQSSPKTSVTYGGSGLGLFISRELTRLQGGRISVVSEYGKGSTFEFYVRATRCGPPSSPVDPQAGFPTRRMSLRRKNTAVQQGGGAAPLSKAPVSYSILLVEDNLVNQKVMRKQLETAGHRVHLANHGGECLEFIQRSRFCQVENGLPLDVILLDLEMPIMGGLEATRRIRISEQRGEISGRIPIIAVTANARAEQQITAREAGVNGVVIKPFQMQELLREVRAVVSHVDS